MSYFVALHARKGKHQNVCVWCFDLLSLNAKNLRQLPLVERKARLAKLLKRSKDTRLRFSESFDGAEKRLASCEALGFEGIVCNARARGTRRKVSWVAGGADGMMSIGRASRRENLLWVTGVEPRRNFAISCERSFAIRFGVFLRS
jgi:ATP-dependent DNA ligase